MAGKDTIKTKPPNYRESDNCSNCSLMICHDVFCIKYKFVIHGDKAVCDDYEPADEG